MISPSRTLIWEGAPVIPKLATYTVKPGETGLIEVPVTNQSGYRDTQGELIDLGPDEHTHYYSIDIFYMIGGSVASKQTGLRALVPAGMGTVDIDDLVQYKSNNEAGTISVPYYYGSVPTFIGGEEPTSPDSYVWIDTSNEELVIHAEEP